MATLKFDPDNTLAGALFGVTPRETIRLGVRLCAAVEREVGADGCHGGVWPGNITWADEQVAVGPANRQSIADMRPEELEFVSPEQFWSGGSTPASDVYSIGLVLYTALNRGVMAYFQKAEDNGPEERAQALQDRMKGEKLAYPAAASRALGDVVLKAVSFRPEDRYATPGQLRAALEALPEGSELTAAVPVVSLNEQEKKRKPRYKVDKDFEEIVPEKRSRSRSGAKNRLAALHLDDDSSAKTEQVMRTLVSGHALDTPEAPAQSPRGEAKPEPPEPSEPDPEPAPVPDANGPPAQPPSEEAAPAAELEPVTETPPAPPQKQKRKRVPGEVDEDIDIEEFRSGKRGKGANVPRLIFSLLLIAVVVVAMILVLRSCRNSTDNYLPEGPAESAAPTDGDSAIHAPVPETVAPWQETEPPESTPSVETEEPAETEPPEVPNVKYELVLSDVSWEQAREQAELMGGHLGVAHDADELQEIIALAEARGIQFVWLGASRSAEDGVWYDVTGEMLAFADWDHGAPSARGSGKDYLMLWYRPAVGYWSCTGQVDDPVAQLPRSYGGKIAYLVEYD